MLLIFIGFLSRLLCMIDKNDYFLFVLLGMLELILEMVLFTALLQGGTI